ncbi:MAG: Sua5/YciO/YrdC/YwlC family protein [Gammaproteobacteria bacterium]|nr:Sua5/YciO/YrdC/YwlC family protein [Gammaproteobacteria bacterium]
MFPDFLPPRLRIAAQLIRSGGVIAYPTEGVFGLGCRPDDHRAVARILALKERPVTAGLILIAASLEQLAGWIAPEAREARRLSATDGPVTWLVTAGFRAPGWITGGRDRIAVRVTRHPVAAGLCRASGMPLVSTSANRRGRPPARTAVAARLRFAQEVDLIVGGSVGGLAGPTEIRDARDGAVRRPG